MKFNLIYADPPWEYDDKLNNGKRGAGHKYKTIDIGRLRNLPVGELAAKDCLLALWWVPPMPTEALCVADAWGFNVKNMLGLCWHKRTKNGKSFFGMGRLTRGNPEGCLFATRGKPEVMDKAVRNYIDKIKPDLHSAKPIEARRRLERLLGDAPRIELFAREKAPGWEACGFELDGLDIEQSLRKYIDRTGADTFADVQLREGL